MDLMDSLLDNKFFKIGLRIAFVCFVLFVGFRIYRDIVVLRNTLIYDEAFHSLKGLLIADDLRNADWVSLLYDSYRQVYFPPLYSLFTGFTFLILPANTVTAVIFSLFMFLLTGVLIFLAASELDDKSGDWVAIIAAVLFLTSPVLIEYASMAMIEAAGLCTLTLTLYIYFKLTKRPESLLLNFLFGSGIVVTYFMKSNYGVLLMVVTLIALLIQVKFRLKRLFTRQNFYFILPIIIAFILWFAYPPKLISTWNAMVNYAWGVRDTYGVQGLLFYPKALVRISGSVWLFVVLLVSFIVSIKFFRDKRVRYLILLILVQLVIGQLHHTKVDRHIFPVLPAFFLLTGFVFLQWWNWNLIGNRLIDFWLPRLATIVLLLYSTYLFFTALNPIGLRINTEVNDTVASLISDDESTLIISTMGTKGLVPPALDWHLITDYHVLEASQSGIAMNLVWDERAANLLNQFDSIPLVENLLLPTLSRADLQSESRTLCLGQPD
jgi:4-amino-4-deoxy-L-arabinose transferase-like glycosyltransferase